MFLVLLRGSFVNTSINDIFPVVLHPSEHVFLVLLVNMLDVLYCQREVHDGEVQLPQLALFFLLEQAVFPLALVVFLQTDCHGLYAQQLRRNLLREGAVPGE